mgnify:CR=1 FL=1
MTRAVCPRLWAHWMVAAIESTCQLSCWTFAAVGLSPRGRAAERVRVRGFRSAERRNVPGTGSKTQHSRARWRDRLSQNLPPFWRKYRREPGRSERSLSRKPHRSATLGGVSLDGQVVGRRPPKTAFQTWTSRVVFLQLLRDSFPQLFQQIHRELLQALILT